jgi:hypothetical protein
MLTKPASTMLPPKNKYVQIQQTDYSKLIREPKATDFASINLEVNEYDKALDGKRSTMILTGTPPFGRVYFQPTNETCRDKKTGKMVPRFAVIDAHRKDMKLMDLAEQDLNMASKLKIPTDAQIKTNICVPLTIKTINSEGKAGKETQYVSEFDAKNISPDIRESMTNEGTSDKGAASPDKGAASPDKGAASPDKGAASPDKGAASLDKGAASPDNGAASLDKEMTLNMDAGQNLFIGSVALLGLYLFFKVLYKRAR